MNFHIYADDTQAYLEVSGGQKASGKKQLEKCLHEVQSWMSANWLQLNASKTEFIVFCDKQYGPEIGIDSITLGDSTVPASESVKSIGAHLDSGLTMQRQRG